MRQGLDGGGGSALEQGRGSQRDTPKVAEASLLPPFRSRQQQPFTQLHLADFPPDWGCWLFPTPHPAVKPQAQDGLCHSEASPMGLLAPQRGWHRCPQVAVALGAQWKASHWHAAALAARGAGSGDCPQAPAPHWVSSNAGGPVGGQLQQLGRAGEGTEKGGRSRWQQDLRVPEGWISVLQQAPPACLWLQSGTLATSSFDTFTQKAPDGLIVISPFTPACLGKLQGKLQGWREQRGSSHGQRQGAGGASS